MKLHGLCECGCGGNTKIATRTRVLRGWVKGIPLRFISGHQTASRTTAYLVVKKGYRTPCWIWQRNINGDGYGMCWNGSRKVMAHRHYYEKERGEIPEGKILDHLCRVPACVNPSHTEPVTNAVNTRRGLSAKLSATAAGEIKMLGTTVSALELAERLGVQRSAIYKIRRGVRWCN